MNKEIFKVGDKVYHIEYGWGEVIRTDGHVNFPMSIRFPDREENIFTFTNDGMETTESKIQLLSFTEYTLQGFSQERPIVLPEVGELCLVKNDNIGWIVNEFKGYNSKSEYPYITNKGIFRQMKRIKILD